MSLSQPDRGSSLIVVAGFCTCAIPIAHVVETMRSLPIDAIPGVPPFLLGLSVIRGVPVPVVDLEAVIGAGRAQTISRFVALNLGKRSVALAVEAVLGIREIDRAHVEEMPPLLQEAGAGVLDAIGVLDAQLLLVLRAGRILSEDLWQKLRTIGTPS